MTNKTAVIDNGTGQFVRTEIQANLQAQKGNNSTGTTPTGTSLINYMSWANTNSNQFQVHNSSAFLPVIDISTGTSAGTHIAKPGTTAIPGYRFLDSSGSATQSGMGLPADTRLGFFVAGSEKLTVLSDGKVGIGTTSPGVELDVKGNATIQTNTADAILNISATASDSSKNAYIDFVADTTYTDYGLRIIRDGGGPNSNSVIAHRGTGNLKLDTDEAAPIVFTTNTADRWKVNENGAFVWAAHTQTISANANSSGVVIPMGIASKGGADPGAATSGNVYNFYWNSSALNCWIDTADVGVVGITSSDYRIKKNITTQTESGIDKIKQLRPVNYEYTDYSVFKSDGVAREGFVAHEVQEVIPSSANGVKDGDSIQSLNMDAIVSVLTKALQEAVAKIETLETKVAALEAS
jgi:hypothetical protein